MHNGVLTDQHIISRVTNHFIYLSNSINTTKGELRLNSLGLYDAMGNTIGDGITPYNAVHNLFGKNDNTRSDMTHMKFINDSTFINDLIESIANNS